MNDAHDQRTFLISADALQTVPKTLTPGQETMRSQRAGRRRLVLLQHCHGRPIRARRLPAQQYKTLRKAYKKIRRGADPATVLTAAGIITPEPKAHDGQQNETL